MAKETEKRLIRTLEFLKEPQGSTIPTLVKAVNANRPQISLKKIVQTLRGCQQNGMVKLSDGRVKLRENMLRNSFQLSKDKNISDQGMKGKSKRASGKKPSMLSKLDERSSKQVSARTKMTRALNDDDSDLKLMEFDDDEPPPEEPPPPEGGEGGEGGGEGGEEDPCKKKPKPKCPKKKPRCPRKKPKCPRKKPKCPKKKPKCPKPKPKCPKPKPKCPKPKPKCPKPKPKCPKPKPKC